MDDTQQKLNDLERRLQVLENPNYLSDDLQRLLLSSGFLKIDTILETFRGASGGRRTLMCIGEIMDRRILLEVKDAFGQWTNGGSNFLYAPGSRMADGMHIILSTTGALPSGLTEGNIVFVRDAQVDQFRVSGSPGGSAITFSGQGTGVHYWESA